MKYIILAAGRGTRLSPLTIHNAKSLLKLDENITLIERTLQMIRNNDNEADIVIVVGFKRELFENSIQGVTFIYNPFFAVTNSVGSLWFAREHLLEQDNVVIMNADVLVSEKLMREVICQPVSKPKVLVDSSIKTNGDYNVEVSGDEIVVMSKELQSYFGEYAGITLLNRSGAKRLYLEINKMIENEEYDQWYENALDQAIFDDDFKLYYEDISDYEWTEVDDVNDLVYAKRIFKGGK